MSLLRVLNRKDKDFLTGQQSRCSGGQINEWMKGQVIVIGKQSSEGSDGA